MPRTLLDAQGKLIGLAQELGRGGEGAVFDVVGRPDTVAKVYLKQPTPQMAAKLSAMAGLANDRLLRIAAWPKGTLHDSTGKITGFTMAKFGGHRPIFQLYLPKSRLQSFPKADWRFLIHAATNAARAFATVHSTGLVIGDVNHGNLVVAEDATVQMIDCDSFQVSTGGQTWFCSVGVGTHQPPEMQGRESYAGIIRTPNHDNFGLAVIVFQLLCIARHPFAGRFLGQGEPPSIEDAIAASRYAYSRENSRTQMAAPPGSLPVSALSSEIQDLFESAFAPESVRGGRPAADRWVTALGKLAGDVRQCQSSASHYYRNGLSACPWCAIEGASGVTLFPVVFTPGARGGVGMAVLWQEVSRVAEPVQLGPCPLTPKPSARPSPEAQLEAEGGRWLRFAAWVTVMAAIALSIAVATPPARALLLPALGILVFLILYHKTTSLSGPFRQKLADVTRDWQSLQSAWAMPKSSQSFHEIRSGLNKLKADYDGLAAERSKRLQLLFEQRRTRQMESYLDRFLLASAKIPGLGQTRVATLASYGIDTAADIIISKIQPVPGFGPSTISKLLSWRHDLERSFRFDPNQGVSPAEANVVEKSIADERAKLEREMASGLGRLKTVSSASFTMRQTLCGRLNELEPRYAQALADVAIVPEDKKANRRLLIVSGVVSAFAIMSALSDASFHRYSASRIPASQPKVGSPEVKPLRSDAVLESAVDALRRRSQPETTVPQAAPSPDSQQRATGPSSAVNEPGTPVGDGEWVTVKQAANVRGAASNTAPVVRIAPQGINLKVYAKTSGWLQLGQDEPWGWVFSGLVEPVR